MNTILIRYGEIFLKGNNRGYFESALAKNIRTALENFKFKFVRAKTAFCSRTTTRLTKPTSSTS